MPGTLKKSDYRKDVEKRLTAYAKDLVRRTLDQRGFAAPSAAPSPPVKRRSSVPRKG